MPTIVIDPGHGGSTTIGGSSSNNATSASGVLEKTMTLQLALLVRDALNALSTPGLPLTTVLTRQTDVNLGLAERAGVAANAKAARFLSIHCNGFDRVTRGVETLVRPAADGNLNHAADHAFATRIQQAVFQTIREFDPATKDRGVKDQKLGVLRDADLGNTPQNAPCRACLLELEFIDVPAVDALLNTGPDAARARGAIARAIAAAIVADLKAG
jgi:N-acetylmuramoyl-L-alanine amidase